MDRIVSDWDITLREPEAGSNISTGEVLELLASLVGKNLLIADGDRYRLLETVRQYGRGHLNDSGASPAIRELHLACYLALAEEAEQHLKGADQQEWLERLDSEHDNLRAALEWSLESETGAQTGLRLGGAVWRFWSMRGHFGEGRRRLSMVLERPCAEDDRSARAKALNGAGALAYRQGDYPVARALLDESLAIWRDLGDRHGVAMSLNNLGTAALVEGDYVAARALYMESLELRRELGDRRGIAELLECLGRLAWAVEVSERAARLWGASESLREATGAPCRRTDRAAYDRDRAATMEALGEPSFDSAFSEGRDMNWEQAIKYALSEEPS